VQGRWEIWTGFWWGKLKVEVGIDEKMQKWILKEIG